MSQPHEQSTHALSKRQVLGPFKKTDRLLLQLSAIVQLPKEILLFQRALMSFLHSVSLVHSFISSTILVSKGVVPTIGKLSWFPCIL